MVGLGLLTLLLRNADFDQLSVSWSWVLGGTAALGIGLLAVAQGLSALRWKTLLGPESAPWAYLFRLYLVAAFFSLFLPTAIGGDAVRAAAASRSLGQPSQVIGTVLADRMLGVAALAAYLAVGLALVGGPEGLGLGGVASAKTVTITSGAAALVVLVGYLFRRRLPPLLRFLSGIASAFQVLAREPKRLGLALVLGVLVQTAYLLAWIAFAHGLGLAIPTESFLVTVPLVSLSTMAPITLSGVGVREGAWIVLLKPYGIPAANALALSLFYFGCWMVVAASGGVLFAWRGTGPGHRR